MFIPEEEEQVARVEKEECMYQEMKRRQHVSTNRICNNKTTKAIKKNKQNHKKVAGKPNGKNETLKRPENMQ